MSVKVVVRYDREGRLSSVEVSGDPAAVHQVLSQILGRAPAPAEPAPAEPPAPEPAPKQAEPKRGRRTGAQQQAEAREAAEQRGLPEFARDNPWLPILARAKQS